MTAMALGMPLLIRVVPSIGSTATSTLGPPFQSPTSSPLKSIGALSFSPSPITTTPHMGTELISWRIASTAAPSPPSLSPRPTQRPAAIAAASVTRTSSIARFRSSSSARRVGAVDSGIDVGGWVIAVLLAHPLVGTCARSGWARFVRPCQNRVRSLGATRCRDHHGTPGGGQAIETSAICSVSPGPGVLGWEAPHGVEAGPGPVEPALAGGGQQLTALPQRQGLLKRPGARLQPLHHTRRCGPGLLVPELSHFGGGRARSVLPRVCHGATTIAASSPLARRTRSRSPTVASAGERTTTASTLRWTIE